MSIRFDSEEFVLLKKILPSYEWAQRTMMTKLDIIKESLVHNQVSNNPIGQIVSRIKTPESIAEKLQRQKLDITAESAKEHLKDIAGIRIICPYERDISILVAIIKNIPDINVLVEKDYVNNPKPSGYRSYHLIIEIPIYHVVEMEHVPLEIQLRTEGMNFWSTLEHEAKYKYQENIPQHLSDELIICAQKIAELDKRMFLIHELISLINDENEGK